MKQLRDGLRVNVAKDILFDSGSAALDNNGIEVLQRVTAQLKKSRHQVSARRLDGRHPAGRRRPGRRPDAGSTPAASTMRSYPT